MEKRVTEKSRICPKCGSETGQVKKGYNRSGTQRCLCGKCGATYTINPKQHAYPEEARELAINLIFKKK